MFRHERRENLAIYSRHAIFYFNLIVYLIVYIYTYTHIYIHGKIGSIDWTAKVGSLEIGGFGFSRAIFSAREGIDEPTVPSTRLETTR